VVNGYKSAAHTDSPDGGTGKPCLGGGMLCPRASSYRQHSAQRNAPVFNLLKRPILRFLARRGDTLHRWG